MRAQKFLSPLYYKLLPMKYKFKGLILSTMSTRTAATCSTSAANSPTTAKTTAACASSCIERAICVVIIIPVGIRVAIVITIGVPIVMTIGVAVGCRASINYITIRFVGGITSVHSTCTGFSVAGSCCCVVFPTSVIIYYTHMVSSGT